MAQQYLVVGEDQVLIDMKLVFSAIRDANGDWQQVEKDLLGMLSAIQAMADNANKE